MDKYVNFFYVFFICFCLLITALAAHYSLLLAIIIFVGVSIIMALYSHLHPLSKSSGTERDRYHEDYSSVSQNYLDQEQIPHVKIDANDRIVSYNDPFLKTIFPGKTREEVKLKGEPLRKVISGLTMDKIRANKHRNYPLTFRNVDYVIVPAKVSGQGRAEYSLNFFDVTLYNQKKKIYAKTEPVFCYITVDNYDRVMDSLSSKDGLHANSKIEREIFNWADRKNAFAMKYDSDKYLVIFEKEKLKIMTDHNFELLSTIRSITADQRNPFSLSIGIGVTDRPATIQEESRISREALEFARSRGGDQAIIQTSDGFQVYGGRKIHHIRRDNTSASLNAKSLTRLINNASNIIVMGHDRPDLDCIGAGLGIVNAAQSYHKEAFYVLPEVTYAIEPIVKYLEETGNDTQDLFIDEREAKKRIDEDTLLIIVDVQNRNFVASPSIIDCVQKIAVIDHHIKPDTNIPSPLLEYTDTSASSASELVSEYLRYIRQPSVPTPEIANSLLAGITMDSNTFKINTTTNTFEAASFLADHGAGMYDINEILKPEQEIVSKKIGVINNAKEYYDKKIAVSSFADQSSCAKIVAAQAADELLNVKGREASFVILKDQSGITIYGRGSGDVNVSGIITALGGGGSSDKAAAQRPDIATLEEAEQKVLAQISYFVSPERRDSNEVNIA